MTRSTDGFTHRESEVGLAFFSPAGPGVSFPRLLGRANSAIHPLTRLASSESGGTRARNRLNASVAPFASPFAFNACPLSNRAWAYCGFRLSARRSEERRVGKECRS